MKAWVQRKKVVSLERLVTEIKTILWYRHNLPKRFVQYIMSERFKKGDYDDEEAYFLLVGACPAAAPDFLASLIVLHYGVDAVLCPNPGFENAEWTPQEVYEVAGRVKRLQEELGSGWEDPFGSQSADCEQSMLRWAFGPHTALTLQCPHPFIPPSVEHFQFNVTVRYVLGLPPCPGYCFPVSFAMAHAAFEEAQWFKSLYATYVSTTLAVAAEDDEEETDRWKLYHENNRLILGSETDILALPPVHRKAAMEYARSLGIEAVLKGTANIPRFRGLIEDIVAVGVADEWFASMPNKCTVKEELDEAEEAAERYPSPPTAILKRRSAARRPLSLIHPTSRQRIEDLVSMARKISYLHAEKRILRGLQVLHKEVSIDGEGLLPAVLWCVLCCDGDDDGNNGGHEDDPASQHLTPDTIEFELPILLEVAEYYFESFWIGSRWRGVFRLCPHPNCMATCSFDPPDSSQNSLKKHYEMYHMPAGSCTSLPPTPLDLAERQQLKPSSYQFPRLPSDKVVFEKFLKDLNAKQHRICSSKGRGKKKRKLVQKEKHQIKLVKEALAQWKKLSTALPAPALPPPPPLAA